MKKFLGILLAVMMAMTLLSAAALADEVPQPEGGKKFEGDWALMGGLVQIVYEEEGYRVCVDLANEGEQNGTVWQYNCYYQEDTDTLLSISSSKSPYTIDADGAQVLGEPVFEGIDEEGQETVFAIGENGMLTWTEGHENAGADLEFRSIGRYSGTWVNLDEEVWVEITWAGQHEETFFYNVYLHRGGEAQFAEFVMTGLPDFETGKLVCEGTATTYVLNADGTYDITTDTETYDAIFSYLGDGKILFEAANGIELTYDEFADIPQG